MAGLKSPPSFLNILKTSLVDTLKANGIKATVKAEPIPTTKLYRVIVLAPQFKEMKHSERQNLIWRIVERLSPRRSDAHQHDPYAHQ